MQPGRNVTLLYIKLNCWLATMYQTNYNNEINNNGDLALSTIPTYYSLNTNKNN